MSTGLQLVAPFSAWVGPLDEIPDEVFAARMLGEGAALDPLEGLVRAPCDGVVAAIAQTNHSVTIRHATGANVLIHVGIDTVAMHGTGFQRLVTEGDVISVGTELLSFDLDDVARTATSARTPMIVLGDSWAVRLLGPPRLVEAGEPVLELRQLEPGVQEPDLRHEVTAERSVEVRLSHGLHARPAARIGAALRPFAARVELHHGDAIANARSVTAVLALGIRQADHVVIRGAGPDAEAAVAAASSLILGGMGEIGDAAADAGEQRPVATTAPDELGGVRAAPGGAIGPAFQLRAADRAITESGACRSAEESGLAAAIKRVRDALGERAGRSDIAEAHLAILDDPDLGALAMRAVATGASAPFAWRTATRAQIAAIEATGNPLLIERGADLRDVERQVIDALLGGPDEPSLDIPQGCILIAQELLPSTLLSIDDDRIAAIVTAAGGPTSHVTVIAATRGIPMIVSTGPEILSVTDGTSIIVEADRPIVRIAPDEAALAAYEAHLSERSHAAAAAERAAREPARTADGVRIEVFANCGSEQDAAVAQSHGAEGCGLLRTEFLFLGRESAPSEDEQASAYAAIASALGDTPMILRTLDAGSDKPIAFLPMPAEENPALGMRGVRVSLARPEILRAQFRAMLRGIAATRLRIMLPMVNDLAEYRRAAAILREEEARLGIATPTPLGIMVETPAAAILADQLAGEASFLSIGTNDLVQYALAADRGNDALATMQDALHPAVLRLIAQAAVGAHARDRWLGVCGALASDPDAAAVLIGLGVDELSVAPRQVPAIKARIRSVTLEACRALAEQALAQEDAMGVRRLIASHREDA